MQLSKSFHIVTLAKVYLLLILMKYLTHGFTFEHNFRTRNTTFSNISVISR